MNEIKINTNSPTFPAIIIIVLLISIVCGGIIYYYRGASGKLESELEHIERLNSELASETRQLQAGITNHVNGIKTIRGQVGISRKRIEHIHIEIEQSAKSANRAIQVIEQCENIIEAVKTQR